MMGDGETTADLDRLRQYDDLCARIYSDKRFPPGTRELALALAWVIHRDPERPDGDDVLRRVGEVIGKDTGGRERHKRLFDEDAPRYDLNRDRRTWDVGKCQGPRLRPYKPREPKKDPSVVDLTPPPMFYDGRGGAMTLSQRRQQEDPGNVCGARGSVSVREYDLVTGQLRAVHWFCRRHKEHADRVREQIKAAGERPEPIPNVGGLLPCYFALPWEKVYEWARPWWKPPYYGVCADDWPSPEHAMVPKRPRLSLVVGQD